MTALLDVFPAELLESIFFELSGEDENYKALKACSSTCRALLPYCRQYIFNSITIAPPFSTGCLTVGPIRLFRQLIEGNPELANYVRHLRLGLQIEDFLYDGLPDVLGQLTRLKSVLIWFCSGYTVLDWKHMPASFFPARSSLIRLMLSPTIISLKLRNIINFPISILMQSTSLQELEIERLTMEDEVYMSSDEALHRPATPVRLKSLILGKRANKVALQMLQTHNPNGSPVFDLACLNVVEMPIEIARDMEDAKTLCKIACNLQKIHLLLFNNVKLSGLCMIVGPSLKKLTLTSSIYGHTTDTFSGLYSELSQIARQNRLENLALRLRIETDLDCNIGDEWGRLDDALLRPGWSALKEVSFEIVMFTYGKPNIKMKQRLMELPDTRFPNVSHTRAFKFMFSIQEMIRPSIHTSI